ncbi:MAG: curli assembly protein CsgF [Pseudomonadales bacterium]|nr:curli assembly protein CsgF [Pseudomonadales bacterium]
MNLFRLIPLLVICVIGLSSVSVATEMVYMPYNPSFGGSPLNGSILLNAAQAQNDKKDPALMKSEESALDEFNDRLQRALLNRLTNTLAGSFVDDDGNLIPGETETFDFLISIVDSGDGMLTVTTTDKVSGSATTFMVESNI